MAPYHGDKDELSSTCDHSDVWRAASRGTARKKSRKKSKKRGKGFVSIESAAEEAWEEEIVREKVVQIGSTEEEPLDSSTQHHNGSMLVTRVCCDPRKLNEVVLAGLLWSACSVGMTLLNKLAVSSTEAPFGILLVQLLFTILAVLASEGRKLRFGRGTLKWAVIVPPLFLLMLCSSMVALQYVSVGAFVVIRNLGPMFTLAIETTLHSPDNLVCDAGTVISLVSTVIGVVVYQMERIEWPGLGVVLLLGNLVIACADRLVQRHMLAVQKVDVSKPGLMLLNNGVGFVLVAGIAALVPGELARTWAAISEANLRTFLVLASAIVGIGIAYAGIWLQSLITATSFMVLGCFCRSVLIVFGAVLLGDTANPIALLGAALSLAGCVAYSTPGEAMQQVTKTQGDDLEHAPHEGVDGTKNEETISAQRRRRPWGSKALWVIEARASPCP